jgi:ribonuclease BN (tRNA processing enzyme)
MEICFLGTGSPYPDPQRASSAILVDVAGTRILLDCGRSCVQQMTRVGLPPSSVTHCFLTHGHYDHITHSRYTARQGPVPCQMPFLTMSIKSTSLLVRA